MSRRLLVTRHQIARALNVNPHSVAHWLAEGLDAARVQPGGPGTPALFDAERAVAWLNARKPYFPVTLEEMRRAAGRQSGTALTARLP